MNFVGLGRDRGGGAIHLGARRDGGGPRAGGTLDAANVTFDSCFSRQGQGGALFVYNTGQATLTQVNV